MPRKSFQAVRDVFAADSGLPFGKLLRRDYVLSVLESEGHVYHQRIFCPLVTLWGWLSQCLSQDKSLNEVVSRILRTSLFGKPKKQKRTENRVGSGEVRTPPTPKPKPTKCHVGGCDRVRTHVVRVCLHFTPRATEGNRDCQAGRGGAAFFKAALATGVTVICVRVAETADAPALEAGGLTD